MVENKDLPSNLHIKNMKSKFNEAVIDYIGQAKAADLERIRTSTLEYKFSLIKSDLILFKGSGVDCEQINNMINEYFGIDVSESILKEFLERELGFEDDDFLSVVFESNQPVS